jgi:hypothetical protein
MGFRPIADTVSCTTACKIARLQTFLVALLLVQAAVAAPPQEVALALDQALAQDLFDSETDLAPLADDSTFLRRVTLDLVGDIPSPEATIAFLLDPSADKRARLVQQLLADPHYGQNWARYWRDVVFFRAQEERAEIAANAMVVDLAEHLNRNDRWDAIAAQFITAQGDVRENGHTAIIMAQDGRTEETAAEISRIFLGIQIQCAQCHDHPYDSWKREQFHELAAFFPRIGVRRVRDMTKQTFEVFSNDRYGKKPRKANNDRRPMAEHQMPDLDDPSQPGQLMQPQFFLTSATLDPGMNDAQRRAKLAQWLTRNEWFSIALVNRIWSELVGESFYELVDDIGPERESKAPLTEQLLAKNFRRSQYDLKWLIATICQTEAYQRASRPRRESSGTPFVANVPQPLRSDQLLNALQTALNVPETTKTSGGRKGKRQKSTRAEFEELFGFDPSIAREEISATIPQSLALMNSPLLHSQLRASQENLLAQLLPAIPDNEALLVELTLRCLSREPTAEELTRAQKYCEQCPNRKEAFEDLLWVLLNSAEFQHRK